MFYNNNNNDEERRRRQMLGLEPNDWSNNTNPNPLPSAKPMEEMTTREALETAWKKQFPYGGHKTMTGPLGDFSYYDENLSRPKEDMIGGLGKQKLFDGDIISPNNSYSANVSNWVDEKNRLSSMNLSDENKHQYMSCLATKGGPAMMATGIAGGIARELDDYRKKLFNPTIRERYNGALGVWMDGSKDLKNNFKGLNHGYDGCNDCQSLLYRKLP